MKTCGAALLMLATAWSAVPSGVRAADPPPAVDSGRNALGKQRYPWYDQQKDSLRPVELPVPKNSQQPPSSNPANSSGMVPEGGTTADVSPLEGHDGSRAPRNTNDSTFDLPAGASQGLSIFAYAVLILLIGTLIGVIVYLIVQNRRQKPAEGMVLAPRKATRSDRLEALPQQARKHVDDLLAEARRCYQEGLYGEAIVYLFSHQLLELDKGELIRLARGKTNRQYLTEVSGRPPLRDLVGQTMIVFEDAFFGNYPIEQQRFENCWSKLDTFQRLVARGDA